MHFYSTNPFWTSKCITFYYPQSKSMSENVLQEGQTLLGLPFSKMSNKGLEDWKTPLGDASFFYFLAIPVSGFTGFSTDPTDVDVSTKSLLSFSEFPE